MLKVRFEIPLPLNYSSSASNYLVPVPSVMDEDAFDKLSIEDRCVHKSWRARISGYASAVQLFENICDAESDVWDKYTPIIGEILLDSNDPALEKGLEVVLNFVLKAATAAKIVGPVVAGLVKKCVASPRARVRDMTLQICLSCVEIGKQKLVIDELLKGTDSKNPKTSFGCAHILTEIVRSFGAKVLPVENLLSKLPVLLEDRDQNVRNEAKSLTVELYRWLGDEIRANFLKPEILKPQKLAEIESEIVKIKSRHEPTRFLKSRVNQLNNCTEENLGEIDAKGTTENSLDDSAPVETIFRIPDDFYVAMKSSKWLERKNALETLEKLLSREGKFKNADFNESMTILVNVIAKDANITVVCLAVKCVTYFSQKLGVNFRPYSLTVFRALLEKLKEKKPFVVQLLREALDAVIRTSMFDLFVDALSESLRTKNPNVKTETSLVLWRCFSRMSQTSLNSKPVRPLFSSLVSCLSDQDPSVREHSAKALGVAMRVIGEKGLAPLFKDLDKTKLLKIKECAGSVDDKTECSKSKTVEFKKRTIPSNLNSKCFLTQSAEPMTKNTSGTPKHNEREIPPQKSCKTMTGSIPEDSLKRLSDKDWSIRLQAISGIQKIVDTSSDFPANLGNLSTLLSARMHDSNPKISTASINLVTSLAEKIGPPFREELKLLLPPLLKAVGDVKPTVRDAAVVGLTKISESCGYSEIFQNECLPESLKSSSITAKAKLWHWVADNLPNIGKEIAVKDLETILPMLFAALEDKNTDVRSEASNAVDGFLKILSLQRIVTFCDKLYGNPNNSVVKLIRNKHNGVSELSEVPSTTKQKPKSIIQSSPVVTRKTVTFGEHSEKSLLDVNNLKNQRIIDEQKHKTSKWDFVAPRIEYVELLKGLMSAANISQQLIKLMFHSDFRCLLKAMDLLAEEILHNSVGIVCNLDLILRWLTLRFFDGNPTVLSKSLDFVTAALGDLSRTNYSLLESEAVAFVPYVVLKLGDSKENVQTKVKEILVNLTSIYPVSKLQKFLVDGTKSNIARQRSNCLDVILSYIRLFGDAVYMGESDSVCAAVGKLWKDRDPIVKKKALHLAGVLYEREGEKIMKFIEKHAGVDFVEIESRIRKYVVPGCNSFDDPTEALCTGVVTSKINNSQDLTSSAVETVPAQSPGSVSEPPDDSLSGKFKWNPDIVQETDNLVNVVVPLAKITHIDLAFMEENGKPLKKSSQLPETPKSLYSTNTPSISSYIENIAAHDLGLSKNSMNYIDKIINSSRGVDVVHFTDLLMKKITQNLEGLGRKNYQEVLENYGTTFTLLTTICCEKKIIRGCSEERLYDVLIQLLSIISNSKFSGKENEIYRKTVNAIILKILENSDKTSLVSSLLRILGDTRVVEGSVDSWKLNELCMKCLWKLNRDQATWDEELDYKVIFSVIQNVLKGFPAPWRKSSPGDMSLRTIKTLLKTMVKLRGVRVMDDAGDSDDGSEFRRFLSKMVQYQTKFNTKPNDNVVSLAPKLAPDEARELSDIFGDFASNSPGAIEKLDDFHRRHPLVDLHRILVTLSPPFHKYLLSVTRKSYKIDSNMTADADPTDDGRFSGEAKRLWDKLKALRKKIETMREA